MEGKEAGTGKGRTPGAVQLTKASFKLLGVSGVGMVRGLTFSELREGVPCPAKEEWP